MKDGFTCIEGDVLKIKGTDFSGLPQYRAQKEDPTVRTVLASGFDPTEKAAILAGKWDTNTEVSAHPKSSQADWSSVP